MITILLTLAALILLLWEVWNLKKEIKRNEFKLMWLKKETVGDEPHIFSTTETISPDIDKKKVNFSIFKKSLDKL